MYIDDEPALCEIFEEEFTCHNVTIVTYTNANQAIESANQSMPDVIFIDYRFADTNGDVVAQALPTEIPKYLVTGEVRVETQYKFNDILGKPFERDRILKIIQENLALQKIA